MEMRLNSLAANAALFTFASPAVGDVGVYAFKGFEQINQPFVFEIELVSKGRTIDLNSVLGDEAVLTLQDLSGDTRFVHGVIMQMEQLHTGNLFVHYNCILVPRLWFLSQTQDHKIFQNQTPLQIIEEILKKHKFIPETYEFRVSRKYAKREYCTQYAESDLSFILRICEEEGIHFYFKHTAEKHCLCFADTTDGPAISGESNLRFYPGSGTAADTAVVSRWSSSQKINSDAITLRDWNFTTPSIDLTESITESNSKIAPVPTWMKLEKYQFPHLYQSKDEAKRYAEIDMRRQIAFQRWATAESDVCRFSPGHTFTLFGHTLPDENCGWWVFSVSHEGEQPAVLEHEAPDERGFRYLSKVTALPEHVWYVPPIEHKKKRIEGVQSAIVTGPENEEIYTDEYGRVKVQFHWDRFGQYDENTTCWVRVAQGWAGMGYGSIAIPRIGHEVLVEFMEGDPDRPIITGRVYNRLNILPYKLSQYKTRTVFKSASTPGTEGEPRGFNELRIEDKKGEEEIFLHAEKDVNAHVKNDWKEHVLHDRHSTVDNFRYAQIKGEDHLTVEQARKAELLADDHLTVHGCSHTEVKQKWLGKAGEEIHLKSGMKTVIEAGTDLTLKAGGAFIRITPAGVTIEGGELNLNSGGTAANGTGASPLLPSVTAVPTPPPPVPCLSCMMFASENRASFCVDD